MNDDDGNALGLTAAEEQLAMRLTRLGPLLREIERAEADIDPGFVQNLRASVVSGELPAPWPRLPRGRRGRNPLWAGAHPVYRRFRTRPIAQIGTVAAALVAILAGVLAIVFLPNRAGVPTFHAPEPTHADLVFSFPAPLTAIHRLTPTVSLVHPRAGVPYAGHLQLTARHLPATAPKLRAYRLAAPPSVATAGRSLLRIHSPVHEVFVSGARWDVAADGGSPSHRPLHSLAVSHATGELIYHDRRNFKLPRAATALQRQTAIGVARSWLTLLGWPGARMPLLDVDRVPGLSKVREVKFGWIGVGTVGTAAATLWVAPDRSVIEAWVWPPVSRGGVIATRSVATAWTDVRAGKLPLAVEGVSPTTRANGTGALRRTTVVSILSPGSSGGLFLVPTYRFEGKAQIAGAKTHTWFSLAPSARR